jgi:hypothetical protein
MTAMTFWATYGQEAARMYAPWFGQLHLVGVGIGFIVVVMLLDYIFVYPSRQAFLNEQSCKHENPAMDSLYRIEVKLADLENQIKELKERKDVEIP